MRYDLDVSIEPASHYLHVRGKIEGAGSNTYYLNENFTLLGAWSMGEKIGFTMDKNRPRPAFDSVSRPVFFDTENHEIEFEYEGTIQGIIVDVNQISEDIVELASYAGWYPKPGNPDAVFDFQVDLHLPEGYEIASNGKCMDGGRIVSTAKEFDIAVFASNRLERFTYEKDNVVCSFLCPSDMIPQMKQRAEDLLWANRFFTEKFGDLSDQAGGTEIVSTFRPGGGWGYKRGNVSFVSAKWGRKEKQYQGDFHELAHGWWSIADVTTANDWINEGGAEFSAFSAARRLYGGEYAEKKIAEYLEEIDNSDGRISIVNTASDSEYRYLNHYFKTTVMYLNAEKVFGEERVFALLREVFRRYRDTCNATTECFLALCDSDMKLLFERYLFADDWSKLDYHI